MQRTRTASLCSPLTPTVRWLPKNMFITALFLAATLSGPTPAASKVPPVAPTVSETLLVPTPGPGQRRLASPSFKGVELYSWQHRGSWCFSMLVGTNRTKRPSEIRDPAATITSLPLLKARLATLAPGETVTCMVGPQWEPPPHPVREDLRRHCEALGISLN